MRTELPGNSQREAPTAAGQGQTEPCSSQSQVHSSASLKFQLFHYFHLHPMAQVQIPDQTLGRVQAPARALAASSDAPTTFGRGVVTQSRTSQGTRSTGCDSISQHCLHCTVGSSHRSRTQGWGFFSIFLVLAVLEPSHLEAG